MPPEPDPAEPEWDDDPAWTRPDPMTAAELEAGLDRVCEHDGPPGPDEFEDFEPFTPTSSPRFARPPPMSCSPWKRPRPGGGGPGQPGSARIFPGQSSSPAVSVRSRVAFFHGQTAQSPFDDRPEPGAFHRLAGRALTTVLECGAGHLDTVLLLGQFGQLVIDHLPLALPLARDETPDLR
jgi:hypothetical protein